MGQHCRACVAGRGLGVVVCPRLALEFFCLGNLPAGLSHEWVRVVCSDGWPRTSPWPQLVPGRKGSSAGV